MKIRSQIILLNLLFVAFFLLAILYALRQLDKLGEEMSKIAYEDHLPFGSSVMLLSWNSLQQGAALQLAIRDAKILRLEERSSTSQLEEQRTRFQEGSVVIRSELEKIRSIVQRRLNNPELATPSFIESEKRLKQFEQVHGEFESLAGRIFAQLEAGAFDEVERIAREFAPTGETHALSEARKGIVWVVADVTKESSSRAVEMQRSASWGLFTLSFFAIVVSGISGFLISRSIVRSLEVVVNFAESIGGGDEVEPLNAPVRGEIRLVVNAMNDMLKSIQQSQATLRQNALVLSESEAALRARTQQLEESNRELEQFAYVASHDLQEPLRMVGSYVQLLARRYKGKLDENADEMIAFAVNGVSRMQTLIQDLLHYSRVGRNRRPLVPIDLNTVVEESLELNAVKIQELGVTVTVGSLPTVLGNATQLSQLMGNLIGNALKFVKDRRPEIHIGAKRSEEGWVISVKDNGIGIPPDSRERVFEIFRRLHTQEEYPGTGIGLAICKKIVEGHGGKIWVESTVGVGTTFFFTLRRPPESATEYPQELSLPH